MRSNLSTTDKECIKAVFDLNDVLQRREVEPVVRCKDCANASQVGDLLCCLMWGNATLATGWCFYGDRRRTDD